MHSKPDSGTIPPVIDKLRGYRPTRRQFLEAGLKTATYGAAAFVGWAAKDYFTPQSQPQLTPDTTTQNKEKTLDDLLQEILDIRPHTEKRVQRENEYLGRISVNPTLHDINRGFWVTADPLVRATLLELLWELDKKGQDKLPDDKRDWIITQNAHPGNLVIADKAYTKALKIMTILNDKGKLRFDRKLQNPEEAMVNPGGMALLIDRETGGTSFLNVRFGFSHIGQGIALEEINEEEFPGGKAAVYELARVVSKKTDLNVVAENIAGSKRGNAKSGGATGPIEFMPPNSVKYRNFILENTGEDLNPFDLVDATVMTYVFLGHHEQVGNDVRYGYWRGHPDDIEAAFAKWFGDYTHARSLRLKAEDFFLTFIGSGKYLH